MRWKLLILVGFLLTLVNFAYAVSDITVFQGQYYDETGFKQGTFEFTFNVYDDAVGGNLEGYRTVNLTTGIFGEWITEIGGISAACNDSSKDYFVEILIDGVVQPPRKRLTHFKYLRKDIEETTSEGLTISGILKGEVPLKIDKGIQFLENGESIFSIYEAKINNNYVNVSSDFYGSLIIETDKMLNPDKMEVCFWDKTNQIMFFCISEGGQNRATTVRRSFQIVGGTSVKENDEDFTLCENANYVDCSASTTGADLLVQDGIEAQSIYANENMTAVYFIGDGSQLTNLSIEESDTFQTITDRGAITNNTITIGSVLNFLLGGYIQEFTNRFLINKDLEVDGNVTADYYIGDGSYLTGIIGQLGANGSQGIPGINGTDGVDGVNGSQGIQGIQGEAGINGTDGDTWFSLISGGLYYIGNLFIDGNINASGNIYSNNKLVCLEDGTNCQVNLFTDTNRSDEEIINLAGIYNNTLWVLSQGYLTSFSEADPNLWTTEFNSTGDSRWMGESVDTNCSIGGSCGLITYDSELNYTIDTDTSASTECTSDEVLLGNGSCISSSSFGGGSLVQYVSFISTVDGKLNKNDRYLALGTDGGIGASVTEMAWIIDRDMTITGILWDSKSNSRTKTSAITLMSGNNKNSLSATSLSKDIQGVVSGSDLTFSVSLSQGNVAAIKYDSGGNGGDIEDLSITLIGTYD